MSDILITCPVCSRDVAKSANPCPSCGSKREGNLVLLGILSFLVPFVGIVLCLAYINTRPRSSLVCFLCAIANMAVGFIVFFGAILAMIGSFSSLF